MKGANPRFWPRSRSFGRLRGRQATRRWGARRAAAGLGGLPELKGVQVRLDELLASVRGAGVEVKTLALLLLDVAADFDGEAVPLRWLEAEPETRSARRQAAGCR